MGALWESGLVMAVVTMVTVGGRCGSTEPGRVGVAAALSTRGRVLVVRTGVTVKVCAHKHTRLRSLWEDWFKLFHISSQKIIAK